MPKTPILNTGNATLFVIDLDQSVRFYTETLGFTLLYQAGPHFAMLELNGFKIGLHPPAQHTPRIVANDSIQIGLDVTIPIAQAVDEFARRGVIFNMYNGSAIVDDGPVKLAFFKDPDGHVLYLCETSPY